MILNLATTHSSRFFFSLDLPSLCVFPIFRYISPASASCYWRRAIRGLATVSRRTFTDTRQPICFFFDVVPPPSSSCNALQTQNFEISLSGDETAYESFLLLGMRTKDTGHHRRDEVESRPEMGPYQQATWNFTTNSVNES